MADINLRTSDLCIRITAKGEEVAGFKHGFDEDLINELKEAGVKVVKPKEEEEEEVDE